MRDRIIINSTVKSYGNSFCIPLQKTEKDLLGINIGDDLEVEIRVMERKDRARSRGMTLR